MDSTVVDNSRRNLLLGAVAATTALAANSVASTDEHKHHHKHNQKNPNMDVIEASLHCVREGNACQTHCIELVKSGDTSIAGCLDSVSQMIPMCETLSKLASFNSKHLAQLANVCIQVCESCEKECRKHEKMHEACRACAESCATCIEECKKIAA